MFVTTLFVGKMFVGIHGTGNTDALSPGPTPNAPVSHIHKEKLIKIFSFRSLVPSSMEISFRLFRLFHLISLRTSTEVVITTAGVRIQPLPK